MEYIKNMDYVEEISDMWQPIDDFEGIVKDKYKSCIEETIKMCTDVLLKKNKEYADDIHPFHNFQIAAELQNTTLIKALAGMMAKHTSSIYDMCNSKKEYPLEKWNEKIVDHINYLLILRAMVVMSH